MQPFIFLGGTVGQSKWRDSFTERLIASGVAADRIFNPVVAEWTPADQEREDAAKKASTYTLFYICDTEQPGNPVSTYSLVEAVMAQYDYPQTTVLVFDLGGLSGHALKSLQKVEKDVRARFPDGRILSKADEALDFFASAIQTQASSGGN